MTSSVQETAIRKTPLFSRHVKLGGSMVNFNGWEMPIQYEGILAEHDAVRKSVGIFDISHMGTVDVTGMDALEFVQRVITNDATRLIDGKALYSPVCNPSGGIVDDVLVYRLEEKHYRFVINAGNRDKDFQWFMSQSKDLRVELTPMSEGISLVAVQGPNSLPLLQDILGVNLSPLGYYNFFFVDWKDTPVMVSRTGYTGELGFELFVSTKLVGEMWDLLLERGKKYSVKPIGLGARDTLRLEMGYCLYGHEIDDTTSPLEAGLAWTVALSKPSFVGQDVLVAQQKKGLTRKLAGLTMQDRSIPRAGCEIVQNGKVVGNTTSGGFSPSLKCGVALGYVPKEAAREGVEVLVRIRQADHPAKIVRFPFFDKKAAK